MSGKRGNGQLIIDIEEMLSLFSHTPSNPSIYRVSDCLRITKEKSYEPLIISIGPFHHGKNHLKAMETLKKRYLKRLVGESSVDRYVNVIEGMEQTARNCYAEDVGLDSYDFVQMLLLDGAFIIEFLREYYSVDRRRILVSQDNPIFGFGHVVSHLLRDLMLLENQIPLFVLEDLLNLSNNHVHDQQKFSDLIWPFFSPPSPSPVPEGMPWPNDAHHLLGLVRHVTCWPFVKTLPRKHGINCSKIENIHSAMELTEAGILFRKPEPEPEPKRKPKKDKSCWLNIRFKNKTIYIPELEISDVTESWFRNMIAYEYYLPSSEGKHITDYAFFLHCLIHSSKDAEVLRRYGIISNWLGGDARVYQLINGLGTNAQISENFSYLKVFRSVNDHCRLRTNRWFAVLRRNHFNNPWTAISLVAAVILLSGAILQVVFAILSYRCR